MSDILNAIHETRDALRFSGHDLERIARDLDAVGLEKMADRITAVAEMLAPHGDRLIKAWNADITEQMNHSRDIMFGVVGVATHFLEKQGN